MAVLLPGAAAFAQDYSGGAVQEKKFPMDNRHEVSLLFMPSVNNTYTRTYGITAQYLYHIGEYFAVGADFMYGFSGETNLVAGRNPASGAAELGRPNGTTEDPCPGANCSPIQAQRRLTRFAGAATFQANPLYGKFNLSSEFELRWDLYIAAGAGVLNTYILAENPNPGTEASPVYEEVDSQIHPGGHIGAGMRFYITRLIAVRFEVRNWMYGASGYTKIRNGVSVDAGNNPIDPNDALAKDTLFKNLTLVGVGVSFVF